MEDLKEILYRLLRDELNNLALGHYYDKSRLSTMKEICHLLTYYKYVNLSDDDILKIVKFYDY